MDTRISKRDYQDRVYVKEFLSGREDAAEKLYAVYKDDIINFLLRAKKCDDYIFADEIAHESIRQVLRFVQRHGQPKIPLRGVLYGIANQLFFQEAKRRQITEVRKIFFDEVYNDLELTFVRYIPTPEEILIKKEEREMLEKAVESLPDHYRNLIIAVYFEGLKYEELSTRQRVPVTKLYSRMDLAKTALRNALEGNWKVCSYCRKEFAPAEDRQSVCSPSCSVQKSAELMRKPVKQIDGKGRLIKTHRSATEAAAAVGVSKSSIYQAIKKGFKGGGYYWKYAA